MNLFSFIMFVVFTIYTTNCVITNCDAPNLPKSYVNVKDHGVEDKEGVDQMQKIQAAIDAVPVGGTLYFPKGHYYVDSTNYGFKPHSDMNIILHNEAIIESLPNGSPYSLVSFNDVENVVMSGGTFLGDRDAHTGSTSNPGGHCLRIARSKSVKLVNILTKDCWGDGLYLADQAGSFNDNIYICNVISDRNLRSAMSIVGARNVFISDSQFSNSEGSDPQSGSNLEPNSGQYVYNITFDNCVFLNNRHYGFLVVGKNRVDGVKVKNSVIHDNYWGGFAITSASRIDLIGNHAHGNEKENTYSEIRVTDIAGISNIEQNNCQNTKDDTKGIVLRTFQNTPSGGITVKNNDGCVPNENYAVRDLTFDKAPTIVDNTYCERETCSKKCSDKERCFAVSNTCRCMYGQDSGKCKSAECNFPFCKYYAKKCKNSCGGSGASAGTIAGLVIGLTLGFCCCLIIAIIIVLLIVLIPIVIFKVKKNKGESYKTAL